MKKIKHIDVGNGIRVDGLIKRMGNAGFGAKKLSQSVDVIEAMVKDKECKVFLGVAGALVPAGMKNLLIEMIKEKYVDVVVSTGANLTHDLIEALGGSHLQGNENVDDNELNKKGIDRIYDVFMDNKVYSPLEDFFDEHLEELKRCKTVKELLNIIGSKLDEKSILGIAYRKEVPIFCPAFMDSGIAMILAFKGLNINQFDDLKEFLNLSWDFEKKGYIYLGGGTPKNYIQQAMQFCSKGGADYGVQITMDRVETGGSSGAELRESISWGKLKKEAKFSDLRADVTIVLPFIVASLKERIKN
ncbi:MAG: deoxyhypusine synthase family protein [Nanoarchaeota archaeon]|nr:deoxyhypusine synthase family protein [Nanoarchaeota archaeon]